MASPYMAAGTSQTYDVAQLSDIIEYNEFTIFI
jgi:hypothetical protein